MPDGVADGVEDAALPRSVALPLAGTDPALPEDDLAPLLERLAGARVVGLGEATHGDRESFQFKHRLIQALVRQRGCRLVIFERGVAEMDTYDRYATGVSDALPMGKELYPWITEEVRDLFVWLREWNAKPAAGGQVRVAGMDMQSPHGLPLALRLREEAGLPAPAAWRRLADEVGERQNDPGWLEAAGAIWRETPSPVVSAADPHGRWIALLADTFRQWLEAWPCWLLQDGSQYQHLRDRFMAENALAQLARVGPDATAALWAHTWHVSLSPWSAGGHLRARLGPAYRAVGFAFGQGVVNAGSRRADGTIDWTLRPHRAAAPPPGSLEALLDRVGPDCYALVPGDAAPLRRPLLVRELGGVWPDGGQEFPSSAVPAESHDLLVYFREVRPSRVLAGS